MIQVWMSLYRYVHCDRMHLTCSRCAPTQTCDTSTQLKTKLLACPTWNVEKTFWKHVCIITVHVIYICRENMMLNIICEWHVIPFINVLIRWSNLCYPQVHTTIFYIYNHLSITALSTSQNIYNYYWRILHVFSLMIFMYI